jgi:RimJ/RimL family protein N-acetyltransferase
MTVMELDLGGGLLLRTVVAADAPLLVEATSGEPGTALWGPYPVGPYSLADARAALSAWEQQICVGVLRDDRLLGAVGLMPDQPGSVEVAYWVRPEQRGQGIATRAVRAATEWAHDGLGVPRAWLEIRPDNEPSLRLARRVGYRFEERIAQHCRDWATEDPAQDTWHDCLIWVHTDEFGLVPPLPRAGVGQTDASGIGTMQSCPLPRTKRALDAGGLGSRGNAVRR